MNAKNTARLYAMPFAKVYPAYVAKAERKGRTKAEVDEIIRWLTGHSEASLDKELAEQTSVETFFTTAPALNPACALITGVVCGVRVEEIEEQPMREIRYLDKLIDELAKGKAMGKILRGRGGYSSSEYPFSSASSSSSGSPFLLTTVSTSRSSPTTEATITPSMG
jgi:hypothetical protein